LSFEATRQRERARVGWEQMPRTIKYFMWGYQDVFCGGVESAMNAALESVGAAIGGRVMLVGFLRPGEQGWPICIEPEDGTIQPEDLGAVESRADELLRDDPDRHIRNSDPGVDARYHVYLSERARARALQEALESSIPEGSAVVGPPATVGKYDVYTAVVL